MASTEKPWSARKWRAAWPYLLQCRQSPAVVLLARLHAGAIVRAPALVPSKRSPSIFQPYWDLRQWLAKGSVWDVVTGR
jgi:hypothetical protein